MDPVQKALWFVESHWRESLTLEDIARECKVSPFHLTRAFATSMGLSLMRYARARRLSEAARRLAGGADDILAVALAAGYGSHEAFTRAFRDQFGATPKQVRERGNLADIRLVEAIAMNTSEMVDVAPPRIETFGPMLVAGLAQRHDCQSPGGIPDQWQRFVSYLGKIPAQVGNVAYGVCHNFDGEGNFDYLCAVEVKRADDLPGGFASLRLAPQKYAVFSHPGHVAGIRATCTAIWKKWFPTSGHQPANAPMFERYGPEFNGMRGLGGLEIWIPITG